MRIITIILLTIMLAACVNFGPQQGPVTHSYTIKADLPATPKHYAMKQQSILVSEGSALAGFGSNGMMYQMDVNAPIAAYAYHRWIAPPVTLIAPQVSDALANTHAFKAVALGHMLDAEVSKRINIQLVKLLQNVHGSSSTVNLVLNIGIVQDSNNQLLATKQFSVSVAASANAEGMVNGANKALTLLLPKIVQFVTESA